MPAGEITKHLQGFLSYVRQLDEEPQRIDDAAFLVSQTKTVLGLVIDSNFEDKDLVWQSLFWIAESYDGFVFVYNSIVLANGGVVIGPLKDPK